MCNDATMRNIIGSGTTVVVFVYWKANKLELETGKMAIFPLFVEENDVYVGNFSLSVRLRT